MRGELTEVSDPEEDLVHGRCIDRYDIQSGLCRQLVVLRSLSMVMYYDAKSCFNDEEDEGEGHKDQDGEFPLHELAEEPEAEQERFPNEEEEPEY